MAINYRITRCTDHEAMKSLFCFVSMCVSEKERGEKKKERESRTVGVMFMQTSACESRRADIYNSTYARPHTESSVCMCACVCVALAVLLNYANRPFNAEM